MVFKLWKLHLLENVLCLQGRVVNHPIFQSVGHMRHPGLELELSEEIFSSKTINGLAYGRYVASKWAQFWNDLIRSWREIAKIAINSHMAKSPMLPNGGILTRPSNKSCRASNSGWKSGIPTFYPEFLTTSSCFLTPTEKTSYLLF